MRARACLPLLPLLLAACGERPTSPQIQTKVAGLFADGENLEIGQVLTLSGGETQAIFVDGGDAGAEYLLVPFNASKTGTDNLRIEVAGGNVRPPSAPRSISPAEEAPGFTRADEPVEDTRFHLRLRERETRELTGLIPAARAARDAGALRSLAAQAQPAIGDTLSINASLTACEDPDQRLGRVAAVTEQAIVVEDLANPVGGFTDEEFLQVGETFDTLIYPVDVRNFGVPTDIDGNGRVLIFYTRVVNELTEPGSDSFVGGFFFSRDLFPREATQQLPACPGSNAAEIFYLLAPDPTGEVNQNVRAKDFVLRSTLGTVAHEFQHLINAGRRIYVNDAGTFEEVWLNEALSHIAEELQFYEVTPLEPRQNIDLQTLRSSQQILDAVNTWQVSNLARFSRYLEEPEEESLLGIDNLPTRGAAWAFLRYAADHDPGPDRDLFFQLVNSRLAGVANLDAALGRDAIDLMQTWTVSVYTDDAGVGVPAIYQQPSWNFRSVMTVFSEDDRYPLKVRSLSSDGTRLTLKGGGAAFLRFGIAPRNRSVITVLSGGEIPPERFRVSLVRLR